MGQFTGSGTRVSGGVQPELAGEAVVVAGGAGEVGEGVVRALLRDGAEVVVPSRSDAKLAALRAAVGGDAGRLHTVHVDIGTDDGAAKLRQFAERFVPLRGLVLSVGEFWGGAKVLDVPRADFEALFGARVFAHLSAMRAIVPLLDGPRASVIQLNGLVALMAIPNLSALGASAAAQLAVTRSLIAEAGPDFPRVTTLLIEQFVESRSRPLAPGALTAVEVGDVVSRLVGDPRAHALLLLGKDASGVRTKPLPEGHFTADRIVTEMSAASKGAER